MKTLDKKSSPRPRIIRKELRDITRTSVTDIQRKQIGQILRNNTFQAKLIIGEPDDKYENEADRVADEVMRMPEPKVKRQADPKEDEEAEPEEEEAPVQAKSSSNDSAPMTLGLQNQIQSLKGSGQSLPESERTFFESRFGLDFHGVKIHDNTHAQALAKSVKAKAFTLGRDVVFGAGEYAPGTNEGKRLIAHELTHVVQQDRNSRFATSRAGVLQSVPAEYIQRNLLDTIKEFARSIHIGIRRLVGRLTYQSFLGKTFAINDDDARVREASDISKYKKYKDDDTIPEGSEVGDYVKIPIGSDYLIDEVKKKGASVFVKVHGYGWTSASNLEGGFGAFIGETLGVSKAQWESEDPRHKTVGDPKAIIRNQKGATFNKMKPKKDGTYIPPTTPVKITQGKFKSYILKSGNKYEDVVRVSTEQNEDLGWTAFSNLGPDPNKPGSYVVTDNDARIRYDPVGVYESAGQKISQGDYVIVKQESQDTDPKGIYIKVAYTKKVEGKIVEDTDKEPVWTAGSNLEGGWADIKGPHAMWKKGKYIGQMDVIKIVGPKKKVQKISPKMLGYFNVMKSAASKYGVSLVVSSGFRDYPGQKRLREKWLEVGPPLYNPANKPGTSQHQWGRALDISGTSAGEISKYQWLQENAWKFGFIRTSSLASEKHHWEYIPEIIKHPEEITKNNSQYSRIYFGAWSSAYIDKLIE